MKKIFSLLMVFLMLFSASTFADVTTVTLYAPDSREITVSESEVESYKKFGWKESKEEVLTTVYAANGAESLIYISELGYYKENGWFENKEDVLTTVYAPDGRESLIYISEIDYYKDNGWFENKEDVLTTIYAYDGTESIVYIGEVDYYTKRGWFKNKEDAQTTIYSPDGRELKVFRAEVSSYRRSGWSAKIEDVTTVMYAPDGRTITVYNAEVEAYKKVGWYPAQKSNIDASKPMVALTFDDGPRPASTGRILDALEKNNAKATFFVLGNLAQNNAQILKRMKSLGCQVGNHTYSHPELTKLSSSNVASQLNTTSDIIYSALGEYPTVIRPPYGSYNNTVLSIATKPLILWSVDTLDWKYKDADYVVNHVLTNVKDGDIILMHDIYDTTASAAERIIPELLSRGYQLVTVDELAKYKNKTLSAHSKYSSFR